MSGEAALAVVRQSPELVDEAVAEHIIRFVAAGKPGQKLAQMEVDPAILSVVCYELNNQRREHRTTRITRELLEGTKEEVLGNFCDSAFEGLPAEVRHFVEDKLLTATGHRDSCAQENALQLPGISQEAIDKLVGRRLIRRDEQRGVARLELAHDRLAAPIQSNREKRHEAEAFEREPVRRSGCTERERQAIADLRRSRRQRRTMAAVATVAIVLTLAALLAASAAFFATQKARQAKQELLTEVIWHAPSGLTWMRRDGGVDLDQGAATRYCQNLRYGGYSDWRLPRVLELLSLVKMQRSRTAAKCLSPLMFGHRRVCAQRKLRNSWS